MMRHILNACILLLIVNVGALFCLHTLGTSGDDKETARSLARLISSYAEPDSNPQSLISAENQCRFWDKTYCARAEAKRKAAVLAYPPVAQVSYTVKQSTLYTAYIETRAALNEATMDYAEFLQTNPSDEQYIERSKEFEEQAGVLLGKMVSYLYDMQEQTARKQGTQAEQVVMTQYLCLMILLLLVCILRLRRGGAGYGQL